MIVAESFDRPDLRGFHLRKRDNTRANGIAIDSSGHAYVTGDVSSSNFPTQNPIITVGPAFLTKFSADGRALVYSTHLQGGGAAVAVDPAGEALLAGTFSGGTAMPNVYVGKINSAGTAFVYSINFGGTGGDQGRCNVRRRCCMNSLLVTGFGEVMT